MRTIAVVFEGIGNDPSKPGGIAWGWPRVRPGLPTQWEWRAGVGEGLAALPDNVAGSVDPFEVQANGSNHTFRLHASTLARAIWANRPFKPIDVLMAGAEGVDRDETTLTFHGFDDWSAADEGSVVWIGDEAIRLGTYAGGSQFDDCQRGWFTTHAMDQPARMNVYGSNPHKINRRAVLYAIDDSTVRQVWQGFVDRASINGPVVEIAARDLLTAIPGAKVNRGAPANLRRAAFGLDVVDWSGPSGVASRHVVGGVNMLRGTPNYKRVAKPLSSVPHFVALQVFDALAHALGGGSNAAFVDMTSASPQLGSLFGTESDAPIHELLVVDRLRDAPFGGRPSYASTWSSTRELEHPFHPVSIAMALLTSGYAGKAGYVVPPVDLGALAWMGIATWTPTEIGRLRALLAEPWMGVATWEPPGLGIQVALGAATWEGVATWTAAEMKRLRRLVATWEGVATWADVVLGANVDLGAASWSGIATWTPPEIGVSIALSPTEWQGIATWTAAEMKRLRRLVATAWSGVATWGAAPVGRLRTLSPEPWSGSATWQDAMLEAWGPFETLIGLHGPIHWWKQQSIAGQNVLDFGSAKLGIRVAGDGSSVAQGDVPAYARGSNGTSNRYCTENASSTAPNGQIILVADEDHVSFGPTIDHVWYTLLHLDLTTGDALTGYLTSLVGEIAGVPYKWQIFYDAVQGESGHSFMGFTLRVVNGSTNADVDIPIRHPTYGIPQGETVLLGYEWKHNASVQATVQGYVIPLDPDNEYGSAGGYMWAEGSYNAAHGGGNSLVPIAGNIVRNWGDLEEQDATDRRVIAHHLTGSAMTGAKIQQSHTTVIPGPVGLQQMIDIAEKLGHVRQRLQSVDPDVLSITTTFDTGTVDIPATNDGDLLIAFGSTGNAANVPSVPSGWTAIRARDGQGTTTASLWTWVYARRSSGGSATTLSFGSMGTGTIHQVYRIAAGTWNDTGTLSQGVYSATDENLSGMVITAYVRDTPPSGGAFPAAPANRLAPWTTWNRTVPGGTTFNDSSMLATCRTTHAVNRYFGAGSSTFPAGNNAYFTINGAGSTQHNLHLHNVVMVRSPYRDLAATPPARPTTWVDLIRYECGGAFTEDAKIVLVAPALESTNWVRDAYAGRRFSTAGVTNFNTSAVWGVANSLRFSGTNAVLADESTILALNAEWTISVCVSSHTLGDGRVLFTMGSGTNYFAVMVNASGHIVVARNLNAAGNAQTTYGVGMSTNTFYGITVKYPGTGNSIISLFFNGAFLGTISTASQAWASATGIRFGLFPDNSGDFDGDMVIRYAGGHALPDYQCQCYSRLNYGAPKT